MISFIINFFRKKDWVYYGEDPLLQSKWGEEYKYRYRRCSNTGITQKRIEYYMMIPETRGYLNIKWVTHKGKEELNNEWKTFI